MNKEWNPKVVRHDPAEGEKFRVTFATESKPNSDIICTLLMTQNCQILGRIGRTLKALVMFTFESLDPFRSISWLLNQGADLEVRKLRMSKWASHEAFFDFFGNKANKHILGFYVLLFDII